MSDLNAIARGKVEAEVQRRIAALPGAVQAIQRELAAKGMVQSGAMLKRVTTTCVDALQGSGVVVITEYRWAVAQSLVATQSWVDSLTSEANGSFAPLVEASIGHIRKAIQIVGGSGNGPNFETRLVGELNAAHTAVQNDVRLALQTAFAEKSRGVIRNLPKAVFAFFSKLLGLNQP